MTKRSLALATLLITSLSLKPELVVAQQVATSPEPETMAYPRVNMATWFEVEPDWPQKPAEFQWEAMPGIAIDRQDRVWTFTRSTPPVQVYAVDGTFIRSWGSQEIETAHHIKIDHVGNVWIADIGKHVVRQFSPGGELLRTLGTPGKAGADETHLNKPTDMAITADGEVFVADGYGNNRVVQFDARGNFVKQWGELGTQPDQFSLPHAIALDSQGRLYVADRNNVRVQVYDQQGKLLDSWNDLIVPWGLCVTEQDEIWVCGASPTHWREPHPDYPLAPLSCPPKDQLVMKFDSHGKVLQMWTLPKGLDGKEQPGEVNWLHALALDSEGNLYVGDIIGKRAQKFVVHRPAE